MTNASAKNTFPMISVIAVAFALFVGAFAGTANAQAYNGGYDVTSPGFVGGDSLGSYPNYTNYTTPFSSTEGLGSYPNYTNYTTPFNSTEGLGSYPNYTNYTTPFNTTEGLGSYPNYTNYTYPSSYTPSSYASPSGYSAPYNYATPYSYTSTPTPGGGSQMQNQSQSSYNSNPNTNVNPNTNTNSNYTPSNSTSNSTASNGPVTSTSSSNPYSSLSSNPYTTSSSNPYTYTNSTSASNPYTTSRSSTGPVTSTNTNTNVPTATAYVAPISNTSTNNVVAQGGSGGNASNGPINISNTVNVVPLSQAQAQPQRLVQYTIPAPYCTITASNAYNYGSYSNQPITLTWSSSNATSAYITPNVGTVNPSGSTIVYPQGYTTYTLTISGAGGTATCQATANYANNYVAPVPTYVAPTYTAPAPVYYSQPASPAVSLTQIPYTGFDYGPVGNAIYWLSLLSFAVAAGYLMVYYRGGALSFATNMFGNRSNGSYNFAEVSDESDAEAEEEAEVAPEITETPVLAHAPARMTDIRSGGLPTIENRRMTTDSMIIQTSVGSAPRIVIARS